MGYPDPLLVASRKLTENVVVSCSGFTRFDRVNFGARMALFNCKDSVVVWSALPFNEEVSGALELLTGSTSYKVSHLIIPDMEHTMAAVSFKERFPQMKIIAMEGVHLGTKAPIDYTVTAAHANKLIDHTVLKELGVTEPEILDNFEFAYVPSHANKELVTYHKPSKTVLEADLLFNLRADEPMEQFSTETGFAPGYFPFSGWSYLARFMNADSAIGRFFFRTIGSPKNAVGSLRAIDAWDFDRLVMCHGNIIETGGKSAFRTVFGKYYRQE